MARIKKDPGTSERGAERGLTQRLAFADRDSGGRLVMAVQTPQPLNDFATGDAIDPKSDVELELPHRGRGLSAEDAVDIARVEAQPVESILKLSDVIAAKEWLGAVETAVAKAAPSLNECPPGLFADETVGGQPARLLKSAYSSSGARTKHGGVVRPPGVAERCEPGLDVAHGWSGCTDADGMHVDIVEEMIPPPGNRTCFDRDPVRRDDASGSLKRSGQTRSGRSRRRDYLKNSCRSLNRACLPFAPTMRRATTPPLNTISVGIDMMP